MQERPRLTVASVVNGFTDVVWPDMFRGSILCLHLQTVIFVIKSLPALLILKSTIEKSMASVPEINSDLISGKSDLVECPECRSSMLKKNFNRHFAAKHSATIPSTCSLCDKSFKTEWSLKEHERTYHGILQAHKL